MLCPHNASDLFTDTFRSHEYASSRKLHSLAAQILFLRPGFCQYGSLQLLETVIPIEKISSDDLWFLSTDGNAYKNCYNC